MPQGPEHGPVISLNRIQIKRGRDGYIGKLRCTAITCHAADTWPGAGGARSVFAQACKAMQSCDAKYLRLAQRVWKVKFIGEGCV